ncbi:MAG TPA: 4-vinyl reductase [Opitutaceae bacterium]|nr:4-vinyl reductase [Opitutaceae bacterium]
MPSPEETLTALGLDPLIDSHRFAHSAASGTLKNPAGIRIVAAGREFFRSLRFILEKENPGTWKTVLQSAGHRASRDIAQHLDAELGRLGKPALSALPLDACLVLIERYLALHGWGRVKFDLADAAEHGFIVARAEHSFAVEALADRDDFADPLLAGMLQGFIEHISGQPLGAEEIACARHGAAACTFVITAQERLDSVAASVGHEPAEATLARFRS